MTDTIIYGLIDPQTDELRYVGKTVEKLSRRLTNHISYVKTHEVNTHLSNWIRLALSRDERPEIFEIEHIVAGDDWAGAERFWISYFRYIGANLTNATDGGEGSLGYKATLETKKKLSVAALGRKHSEETCRKISMGQLGNKRGPHTDEAKRRIGDASRGRKHTDETKLKIGIKNKERMNTNESREHMRQIHLGRKASDETRKKISEARLGKRASDETRKKQSESRIRWLTEHERKRVLDETNSLLVSNMELK